MGDLPPIVITGPFAGQMPSARDTLRGAQAKLASAKVAVSAASAAVARGEKYLGALGTNLSEARETERLGAVERAGAFAFAGDIPLDAPVLTKRRHEVQDQVESAKAAVDVLRESLAHAVEAERAAGDAVERAIAAVMAEEAADRLARLQELEHSSALLRSEVKSYDRGAFTMIQGQSHVLPPGLAAHILKEPENSLNSMGWMNGPQARRTEACTGAWRDFRAALKNDSDVELKFD